MRCRNARLGGFDFACLLLRSDHLAPRYSGGFVEAIVETGERDFVRRRTEQFAGRRQLHAVVAAQGKGVGELPGPNDDGLGDRDDQKVGPVLRQGLAGGKRRGLVGKRLAPAARQPGVGLGPDGTGHRISFGDGRMDGRAVRFDDMEFDQRRGDEKQNHP